MVLCDGCELFQFKSKGGSQVKEYCSALTKEDCRRQSGSYIACEKVVVELISLNFSIIDLQIGLSYIFP